MSHITDLIINSWNSDTHHSYFGMSQEVIFIFCGLHYSFSGLYSQIIMMHS